MVGWGGVGVPTDYLVAPVSNWTGLGCDNNIAFRRMRTYIIATKWPPNLRFAPSLTAGQISDYNANGGPK